MGSSTSNQALSDLVTECLDSFQRNGLSQLHDGYDSARWCPSMIYGRSSLSRTKAFQEILPQLTAAIKNALKISHMQPSDINAQMGAFIVSHFTRHVMNNLLNFESAEPVAVHITKLKKNNKGLYDPPSEYDLEQINAWKIRLTKIAEESGISLDTTKEDEKTLLSARLAFITNHIIGSLDWDVFMTQVIEYYQREIEVRKAITPRLFSSAVGAPDEPMSVVCFDAEENNQDVSNQAMKK